MKKFFQGMIQNIADYIRETDKLLLGLCAVASLFGCALVFSATRYTGESRQFFVQLLSVCIGVAVAIVISLFDYKTFANTRALPIYLILSILLLGITYFFGYAPDGTDNKAWISLPFGMSLQVSELIKIFLIISFSTHVAALNKQDINRPLNVLLLALHGLAPAAVVMVLQRDLGTCIILGCVFLAMLFAAGVKLRYFAISGVLIAAVSPLIWFFGLSEYQRERFTIILNLESEPLGRGYQQLQALRAIGSGGITGYGYLNGPKTQSGSVPKAYNDFIFSVAGEELGMIGCLVICALLLAIVIRIIRIGVLVHDRQGSIICAGVFGMFTSQIIINLGMCLALLPVIGVTLPFFSAGGTSLICLYLGVGLVLSVYKNRNKRQLYLRDV